MNDQKNKHNHHPEVVKVGSMAKDLLPGGGEEMFSSNVTVPEPILPVNDNNNDVVPPVTPPDGGAGGNNDGGSTVVPPVVNQSFNDVVNELKLQDQIKTPEDLARAYKALEAKFTTTSQDLSTIKRSFELNPPMNPAIMTPQQQQKGQLQVQPQPQYPNQPQYQPQQPAGPVAPKELTEADIEKMNEDFIDNPVTAIKTLLSGMGLMTQNDYANIQRARQAASQQRQAQEERLTGIISTLPDYDKYQATMTVIYENNPYYKQINPEQGIPLLYNAAKLIVGEQIGGGGNAPNPAIQQQNNNDKNLANTHSGGNNAGGGGDALDNMEWDNMSPEAIEKTIGHKARF